MPDSEPSITIERLNELEANGTALIEGLPGHGLVAAIAVDQFTKQLHLEHHGNILSDDFPPVTSFVNGRVQDLIRVYGRTDPPVMTPQSDVALPRTRLGPLSQCVLEDLS